MMLYRQQIVWITVLTMMVAGISAVQANEAALWKKLQAGGYIVLFRHAIAPGSGDPVNFQVDDCSTQRNLSEAGREQSRRIGTIMHDQSVPIGQVLSSAWCRCKETAKLAFGRYEIEDMLNSFYEFRENRDVQIAALKERLTRIPADNLIIVTHYVNIAAATGKSTSPGEAVVVKPLPPDDFHVIGSLMIR